MSKQLWKPGALLAPVPPVLVSCGTVEKPNLLTIGWTGIVSTHPAMTYISVRPERYSYPMIREGGCFVINLTTEALCRAADFCGVRSGREVDKLAHCGLTVSPASTVSAPILNESPVNIECRVQQVLELGSHHMFLAEITAIQVDDRLVDGGRLCLDRAGLVAYAHGEYFALGDKLGSFGYTVRKRPQKKDNAPPKKKSEQGTRPAGERKAAAKPGSDGGKRPAQQPTGGQRPGKNRPRSGDKRRRIP